MQPAVRLALLLSLLASPTIAAERLVGRARVIDGDTIVVGGVHVRLQGVAAPEVAHPGLPHNEPGGLEARDYTAKLLIRPLNVGARSHTKPPNLRSFAETRASI